MSVLNWALNTIIILVCGVIFYFLTPLLDFKVKKIIIVTLLLVYSVLYFIGYGFHTELLNAITIRPHGMSISLVGVVLLGIVTFAFSFMFSEYLKKN